MSKLTPSERLKARTQIAESECWEWQGHRQKHGYGVTCLGGKHMLAHRAAYTEFIGPIPDGLWVLHRCDNPPCINPDHLFLGTVVDNVADMMSKGRHVPARGARQTRSRLTVEQVHTIRERYRSEPVSQRALAREYGVSRSCICNIIYARSWAYVDNSFDHAANQRHNERVRVLGEQKACAKLTEQDVRHIRRRYRAGDAVSRDLAADFGVDRSVINRIVNHKAWAHVVDDEVAA